MITSYPFSITDPPGSAVQIWAPDPVPYIRIDVQLGEVWLCDHLVDAIRPDRVPWRVLNALAETPFVPVDRTRLVAAIGERTTCCEKDVARDGIRRLREQLPHELIDPRKLIATRGDGRWALVAFAELQGMAA